MANDDRILLNLVLNEATVSAVKGRVRSLVNRLNNQNISLNINGRNLDNILNRLGDIQQRMQTINSTHVNINANLTSAQQQYRLETERMRVAQQLELSRQRTLQTENQAVSALAQQNRTLNINNNVTHQIERGAQNIGNNMNVAGGHARDFVDYLADGARYLVVYRSLNEIVNQFGEALNETKNVDKELVSVRKVTGMAESEIEKIRKSSYSVATEYGRTASEYLSSVSEFARGGYKELSTELAKVSLLTQNVGDVNQKTADSMLLSVDAAYDLKGNVSELTNVVNGLNNIANLNPTSMQKMADGMQVSASMAKVAGLEISDLVALIGTGTAVSQREGSEVARGVRTMLMRLRQVKGELEDGTVIDDESIAKAEAALKGVGIATKEVVNGVRELRNPMDILEELSQKWSTLGSEAKSALTEGIANQRQADVFSAIIENYDTVKKMQNEYLNSANSAIKENELYLQGWEATQNKVSAKWTEFIANMADTALITGSLKALYDVLVVLDTPIGRIATSIVLVNTALAVSNRLWQAIRARSIVADILSMGVAERNLGTAIQLVSGHLGRQALAWATSPLGMATIAVAGIALITSAIEKNSQKLEENAQKAGEAYDKVKSNMNELDSLIKQYNDLQLSNEWNNTPVETKKQLHEDINRLLGDEADKIDILNGKYKETTEELFKQRMAKLPEEEKTAFDNEQAKGKTLWDTVWWNNGIHTSYTSVLSDEEEKILDKYSHIFTSDHTTVNGEDVHNYQLKFDNFQDFLYKYDEVKKLLQDMYNEGLGETETYKKLNDYIAQFETKVNDYKTAVEEFDNTKAGQKLTTYISQNVGGYIDNLEEYNKVVDWIKNNFTGEDKNRLLGFLNSYFSEYAEKATETSDLLSGDFSSAIKSVSTTLSTLQGKYDELKSAQDEYNSTEAISAETMQKLIDNDLLQYLDYSSGKLKINTDALLAEGEAAKVNAIQKLQDAMATDLMNLATGKTDQLSTTAKTAIANLGSAAETAGNQAETAAGKLAGFAIAAQAAKDGAEGNLSGMSIEDFGVQADAIIAAYTGVANSIGGITIKSPKTSGGSTSKNSALDNYLKDAENRYKIHQNETTYINDLNYALSNLVKTEDERLDVVGKINEAYRDLADNRIKDLEHQIDLTKELKGEDADVTTQLAEIQRVANEEATRLRAMGYDDNSNEIQDLQKTWWDAENKKLDYLVATHEKHVSDIEHEIEMALSKNPNSNISAYYEQLQVEYHKEADRLRAIDPEKYAEDIQELQRAWWDAEENKQDNFKERHDATIRNIEHERDLMLERDPFADTTSYYKQMQDLYHQEAERLRALDPVKYAEEIQELQQNWWDAQNAIVDWRWENSQNWIDQRNAYNDWALFDDSEIQAWERVVKWLKEEYPNELDRIREAEQSLFEARKAELNKATDFASSYYDSQKTLLQSYFDVTNSVAEAQHEINKELETSKTMYEWLDEETRRWLFNQEDYNALSKELIDIQSEADRLQKQYEYDLENSTLNTIEEITSNYQMQYETLMKSYEIAKADLEVAKKKAKLNNVLNERNVRMFINGQWRWVADTQDVINAKGELADAEYAQKTAAAGLRQTESINELTAKQDQLGTTIKKFEDGVIDLDGAVDDVVEILGKLPSAIESYISTIQGKAFSSSSANSSRFPTESSSSSYTPRELQVGADGNAPAGAKIGDIIVTSDGKYGIVPANTPGAKLNPESGHWSVKLYGTGTRYTSPGNALMGEDGAEMFIDSNGHLIPINQPTFGNIDAGGIVFNQDQMDFARKFWDWSNGNPPSFNYNVPDYSHLIGADRTQNTVTNNNNCDTIIIKDLVVDSGSAEGQALVNAIRRYVPIH